MNTSKMNIENNQVTHEDLQNRNDLRIPKRQTDATELGSSNTSAETNRAQLKYINVFLGTLTIIAISSTMYLAQAFFLPLLIGILASYTLSPVVEFLNRCHIPRAVGAALVVALLIGALSWLTLSLSSEATALIEKLPDATRKLRQHLSDIRPPNQSTLQNMQEAAKQIEGAAADASINSASQTASVNPGDSTAWAHDFVLKQSLLIFSVIAQAPIILMLIYFLLASGTHFRRKLVQFVGPSLERKKEMVSMLDEIDMQIQLYLLSMLVASFLVGIATWLGFKALGMEQAGIWGVIAGMLQFIPYLGPAITAIASGIASFLQFGSLLSALATVGVVLLISAAIGMAFTTWLQSRFAHINAAVLFIALLFFAWLWGLCGLLLGAPLVAIIKVVCDRVDPLNAIGKLLGR
jgi:predicted PurR-regulated permease PerM